MICVRLSVLFLSRYHPNQPHWRLGIAPRLRFSKISVFFLKKISEFLFKGVFPLMMVLDHNSVESNPKNGAPDERYCLHPERL